ncbi:unnamed protein product [Arctogadus glacialis]
MRGLGVLGGAGGAGGQVAGGPGAGLGGRGVGARGYNPAAGGYNPAAGGYNPAAGGYNPAAGGYNPAAGGYNPAAAKAAKYGVQQGIGTGLVAGGYSAAAKAAKYGVDVNAAPISGGAGGPTVGGALPEPRGDGGFADSKTDKYAESGITGTGIHLHPTPGQAVEVQPGLTGGASPAGTGVPVASKPAKEVGLEGTPGPESTPIAPEVTKPIGGGVVQPSGAAETGLKPAKSYVAVGTGGTGGGGIPNPWLGYRNPYGAGAGLGGGPGGVLPLAKPLKPPAFGGAGGAGIPLSAGLPAGGYGPYGPYGQGYGQGGQVYPAAGGLGPGGAGGYGHLGAAGGYPQGAVAPGYGGGYPQQAGGGYVPAPLTPQQAKAAKYGALGGFLGGAGGGAYRGCQGKFCGRRK